MKTTGKIAILILIGVVLCFCAFGCAPPVQLTYDDTTDYGLYWYGGEGEEDYVRSSQDVSERYFDPQKPTYIYFHGWKPEATDKENKDRRVESLYTSADGVAKTGEKRNYAQELRDKGYNVGEFAFFHDAASLTRIFEFLWIDFRDLPLAAIFASEFAVRFADYHGQVTFAGHSFGAQAAVATAYMLNRMAEQSYFKNRDILPQRITLADPYLGDLAIQGNAGALDRRIGLLEEEIGGRLPAELTADCIEYLNGKSVAIDAYCGMPLAYDAYATKDAALKAAIEQKLRANTVWTVLEGLQNAYGKMGAIHNLTRDWMLASLFVTADDGPTAGMSNQRARELVGKRFVSQYEGLNPAADSFREITG